jgi:hypothetical protein
MISKDKLAKAKQYIKINARPLDQALFRFEFNEGSPEPVLNILKTYQNKEGGFGHALEPDFRVKNSSILATTVALQYVNELNLKNSMEMVERGIKYLVREVQQFPDDFPLKYFWYLVPNVRNQSLHAPWWSTENLKPPEIGEWPNPSVEVIGYLIRYSQFVPQSLLDEVLKDLQNYLKLVPILTGYIYYKFLCFKRLMSYVSKDLKETILAMLDRTFESPVYLTDLQFERIKIQWFVTEKTSYLYQKHAERITRLIDNEVKRLGEDGGSHPTWKWGDPELWEQVEREWTGKCTHELLVTLKYCDLLQI